MGGNALGWIAQPIGRLIALRSHHGSHRRLLMTESVDGSRAARVDALVVPASRPMEWLRSAMGLAGALECVLVALCSRQVSASEATALGERLGVTTVAVDIDTKGVTASFGTSVALEGSPFERISDVSDKRNIGLQLAWIAGWDRVLFLDDDISDVSPSDATAAAAVLDDYHAVGMDNGGFPDNSVVCHAYRAVGGPQEQFVGAGALVLSPARAPSFFPHVYNDDWFLVIGQADPPRVAVSGSVKQAEFDPFADPGRARREEFGDSLAEGLYWLLDRGRRLDDADGEYWQHFLARRRRFLDRLLWLANMPGDHLVDHGVPPDRLRASLEAARETSALITPEFCVDYLMRWRVDLLAWRRHLNSLPTGVGVERAVAELGLKS